MAKGRARNPEVFYTGGYFVDSDGNVITGISSYTWAEFIDAGFDLTVARHVKITDKHSANNATSTPGSLWWIDPTAVSARKRQLVSGPIWNSSFATALSTFPPASYPGLLIRAADAGKGRIVLEETGGRYKPQGGMGMLFNEVNGTLSSPTKSLGNNSGTLPQLFILDYPDLPGNLVQQGDTLFIEFDTQRHGVGTMTLVLCLGTSLAVLTDAVIWSSPIATTDLAKPAGVIKIDVGSNTSMSTNGAQGIQQTGGSGAGTRTSVTANLDFTVAQKFKMGLSAKATDAETFDLMQFSCMWVAV
jgi:hypothetical protein